MARLAIKGHPNRGKEVIGILEMLGGKNTHDYMCNMPNFAYIIDEQGIIDWYIPLPDSSLATFTLEEFLEKFPYKVGDKVLYKTYGIYSAIKTMKWNSEKEQVFYRLDSKNLFVASADELKPYKEETIEDKGFSRKKMYDNYNYPPGADGPDAPWNQSDPEEREFKVTVSQTLSKNTTVTTSDYIPGGCFPETEWDIDGYHTITCHEPDDTSDTDWKAAYNNEHYTPLGLIQEFKEMLEKNTPIPETRRKYLIDECMNWIEDDLEVCEG